MSAQTRKAPTPRCSVTPSAWLMRGRTRAMSTREKSAKACPCHSVQRPGRVESRGCLNVPTMWSRSPHPSGSAASTLNWWLRTPLRIRKSSRVNIRGSPPACSSTSCTVAWRITNSCCEKNQSAAGESVSEVARMIGNPATYTRPSSARRTSRNGCSTYSWSKSRRNREPSDTEANTRGRRNDSRPCASSSTTPRNSKEGTSPPASASISAIRTGTPSASDAHVSSRGRASEIRGTIKY